MRTIQFTLEKQLRDTAGRKKLGRVGVLKTPHGDIETPAFVTVGTKATVKALTPEQVSSLGAQVVLANTYHLYLQPGHERVKAGGGLGKFMNWPGPTMTDSGGFQAFSLGAAFGIGVTKISKGNSGSDTSNKEDKEIVRFAKITEDGVEFRSVIDGSTHFFSPERSMEIQNAIGADMIFAFDECTSPQAPYQYQKESLGRTHRWAARCLDHHIKNSKGQALFGIVQGGRFEELRKESASKIGSMDFDGYGIGGSFEKKDMDTAVGWVNSILPEDKPRHLLGIGEPLDLFGAVENGCDLFDCVAPTRIARNGSLYTSVGRLNIMNAKFMDDLAPIEKSCGCYACQHYSRAYLAHLFRAKEILANTLASIHNLYFIIHLVEGMRQAILDDNFDEYRSTFLNKYMQSGMI